jgi:hypothetical protein
MARRRRLAREIARFPSTLGAEDGSGRAATPTPPDGSPSRIHAPPLSHPRHRPGLQHSPISLPGLLDIRRKIRGAASTDELAAPAVAAAHMPLGRTAW